MSASPLRPSVLCGTPKDAYGCTKNMTAEIFYVCKLVYVCNDEPNPMLDRPGSVPVETVSSPVSREKERIPILPLLLIVTGVLLSIAWTVFLALSGRSFPCFSDPR